MPFNRAQFQELIDLIAENKSTELEYFRPGLNYSGDQKELPPEWRDAPGNPVRIVSRTIEQPVNNSGPHRYYYKWIQPNGLDRILTPAFRREGIFAGLRIEIPQETRSDDLEALFAAISQNNAFAAKVAEIDFTFCQSLERRVIFPHNLVELRNLIMDRMSKSTTFTSHHGSDDPWDGTPIYSAAVMGTPDISGLQNLYKLSFNLTRLREWPTLPKSLVEYTQFGSYPMRVELLNLSSKALPNLNWAYFEGNCANPITQAYAICLSHMLTARPHLKVAFPDERYKLTDSPYNIGIDVRRMPLNHTILDEHFDFLIRESTAVNRELITAEALRQSASILNDMLVDANDIHSQAALSSYVQTRLPHVIKNLEVIQAQRQEQARQAAASQAARPRGQRI